MIEQIKGGKMGIKTLKYRGKKSLQSLALPTKKIEIKEILWWCFTLTCRMCNYWGVRSYSQTYINVFEKIVDLVETVKVFFKHLAAWLIRNAFRK